MYVALVEFSTSQVFPPQIKKLYHNLDINKKGNVHGCRVNRVQIKDVNTDTNIRVKTRTYFRSRQRTDLGTRIGGPQKSKFRDKTPQGPRSIQLSNRFAIHGELDELMFTNKVPRFVMSSMKNNQEIHKVMLQVRMNCQIFIGMRDNRSL